MLQLRICPRDRLVWNTCIIILTAPAGAHPRPICIFCLATSESGRNDNRWSSLLLEWYIYKRTDDFCRHAKAIRFLLHPKIQRLHGPMWSNQQYAWLTFQGNQTSIFKGLMKNIKRKIDRITWFVYNWREFAHLNHIWRWRLVLADSDHMCNVVFLEITTRNFLPYADGDWTCSWLATYTAAVGG